MSLGLLISGFELVCENAPKTHRSYFHAIARLESKRTKVAEARRIKIIRNNIAALGREDTPCFDENQRSRQSMWDIRVLDFTLFHLRRAAYASVYFRVTPLL
jgi:hypothetical protein